MIREVFAIDTPGVEGNLFNYKRERKHLVHTWKYYYREGFKCPVCGIKKNQL